MENKQPVFPLNIVRQMREQRLGMIQTAVSFSIHLMIMIISFQFQSQYQFACEAILYANAHGLIENDSN